MYSFATIQNVTDRRQTTDRQTTHRAKGTTNSTVGQKPVKKRIDGNKKNNVINVISYSAKKQTDKYAQTHRGKFKFEFSKPSKMHQC